MINIFRDYTNPIEAKQVWEEYKKEINRLCILDKAEKIAGHYTTALGLDFGLDELISSHKDRTISFIKERHSPDIDARSYWSAVVKSYEQERVAI